MFGYNNIDTFTASELVSQNLSSEHTRLPAFKAWCFALAACRQASGYHVLAASAWIFNAPRHFNRWRWWRNTADWLNAAVLGLAILLLPHRNDHHQRDHCNTKRLSHDVAPSSRTFEKPNQLVTSLANNLHNLQVTPSNESPGFRDLRYGGKLNA